MPPLIHNQCRISCHHGFTINVGYRVITDSQSLQDIMSSLIHNNCRKSCRNRIATSVGYHAITYSVIVGCHVDTELLSLWDITDL